MTQLILNGITLPESQKQHYSAWEEPLGEQLEMISGRMVVETRGIVWRVSYQYGYLDDETRKAVLAACKKGTGAPIPCSFLPPDGTALTSGQFLVTDYTPPKFAWSTALLGDGTSPRPVWADFAVQLREVRPHA